MIVYIYMHCFIDLPVREQTKKLGNESSELEDLNAL